MAKILKEEPISGRAERKRLAEGLYWRAIDPEVHLGYRKGRRGGTWLVRWRVPQGYSRETLGTADDELKEGTLNFDAAVRSAREVVQQKRLEQRAEAEGPALTVRRAVEAYIAARDERDSRRKGRPVRSDARSRLERLVIGREKRGNRAAMEANPLADIALHALTEEHLKDWCSALPAGIKATSHQRTFNDFKSALNEAYEANHRRLPPTLPTIIKRGLKAPQVDEGEGEAALAARSNQILSDAQVGSVIKAAREIDAEQEWDGDLFRMVVVMAATGARSTQLFRMRVRDMQVKEGRLMVPTSRKGRKGRTAKKSHEAIPVGKDILEALAPAVVGRPKDAVLLERTRWEQVAGSIRWQRAGRGPWQSASDMVRPWALIRERAGLPEIIPYSLRHTSIVRAIRANLPIRLIAALHDTSVTMIERHYSHWITEGLAEMVARAVVPLVPPPGGNVVEITARDRG